jgi:fructose-1,6-bisphosphatase/inositol monophosphatase family enzyme
MSLEEPTLDLLKQIALKVSKAVSPLIGTKEGAKELERGAGGDISMRIDTLAEEIIIEELEKSGLDILLMSEEVGNKYIGDKEKVERTERKLIVDPIDGSTNSSRGIPFYSISIAYAEGSELEDIKKGLIIDISTNDLYWANKGEGAFLNGNPISVSQREVSDKLIFEIDFSLWNLHKKLRQYREIIKKLYRVRVMGSMALSFCLLAKGAIDGYMDFRTATRIVDIAAGYLIIKEAGGKFFTISGTKVGNKNLERRIPPLIACNPNLVSFLKKELKKVAK